MQARCTYIWEFLVASERREEFERQYGPGGAWVTLFRQSPGYIETLLLQDPANSQRYLTIDRWESEAAYRAFRERFAGQYADLDARFEHLTTRETPLGCFNEAMG